MDVKNSVSNIGRVFIVFTLCIGWLIPNHYPPWASFWHDWIIGVGFSALFLVTLVRATDRLNLSLPAAIFFLVAVIPILQWWGGQVYFFGDAFIATLYLGGFSMCIAMPSIARNRDDEVVGPLVVAIMGASFISVGLALCQWLDLRGLGIFLVDLPAGGRPYANLAQPNQLATLLMLGLVSTLALYQRRKVGSAVFALLVGWLCFGLAMTQSRMAWIGMAVLTTWLLLLRHRSNLRINSSGIFSIALVFFVLVAIWPTLCAWLFLSAGRSLADQASPGVRFELWALLLDAISRQPWLGYGWNQVAVAQIRVADAHAATGHWMESSHNILLDLVLFNGIPLGIVMLSAVGCWLWRRASKCSDSEVGLALGGIFVVGVHALFEFPLHYAYFLLPVGLMVGYVEYRTSTKYVFQLPRAAMGAVGVIFVVILGCVVYEYSGIEESSKRLRFEMAGFEPANVDAVEPRLLTQLEEIPRFARKRASHNMSAEELTDMKMMAERFGFPPVLFRYSLAAGLNGDPATAGRMLKVLCHVHPAERCAEAIAAWRQMAAGPYPELQAVPLPAVPASVAPPSAIWPPR
jgi:hypothetical protein